MKIDTTVKPTNGKKHVAPSLGRNIQTADFIERVRINQQKLTAELKPHYDFIVCGSGSSGSVVARRLTENPDVNVLLLEAGGTDDVPRVTDPGQWFQNLGSERDWSFVGEPNHHLNGRSISSNMGKVLGGGSSINTMVWARGHRMTGISLLLSRATPRGTMRQC
jgi:choline dehydrogenase